MESVAALIDTDVVGADSTYWLQIEKDLQDLASSSDVTSEVYYQLLLKDHGIRFVTKTYVVRKEYAPRPQVYYHCVVNL